MSLKYIYNYHSNPAFCPPSSQLIDVLRPESEGFLGQEQNLLRKLSTTPYLPFGCMKLTTPNSKEQCLYTAKTIKIRETTTMLMMMMMMTIIIIITMHHRCAVVHILKIIEVMLQFYTSFSHAVD